MDSVELPFFFFVIDKMIFPLASKDSWKPQEGMKWSKSTGYASGL